MISRPNNWIAIPGIKTQTLIAPEGVDAAGIRYTERVRPLRRMGDIVGQWSSRKQKITQIAIGNPERLLTTEGEHAGFVIIDGVFNGNRVQASLGVVFGDDFYALIEGFALREDVFDSTAAMVRELTISDHHVLGPRRRRYEYTLPQGWQGIVRGFTTDWVSPRYPLECGLIVAYAAAPVDPSVEVDLGALAARAIERGFAVDTAANPLEVKSEHGLIGVVSELVGPHRDTRVLRSFVTLTDSRFLYSCELLARTEDHWAAHRQAFTHLWQSVVPIPNVNAPKGAAGMFEFWVD